MGTPGQAGPASTPESDSAAAEASTPEAPESPTSVDPPDVEAPGDADCDPELHAVNTKQPATETRSTCEAMRGTEAHSLDFVNRSGSRTA